MKSECYKFYAHSGKFGIHGPILAVAVAVGLGYFLGILYSLLMDVIPLVFLKIFIPICYGIFWGFITSLALQFGKVRNRLITLATGISVGILSWYFAWNGYLFAHDRGEQYFASPNQVWSTMNSLMDHNSWALRRLFRTGNAASVTGIQLLLVWIAEGALIVGLCTVACDEMAGDAPFCEEHNLWFDEVLKLDSLDAFTDTEEIAELKRGNIVPLLDAWPRGRNSGRYAVLTRTRCPQCQDVCALSLRNVTLSERDDKLREMTESIFSNLIVPMSVADRLVLQAISQAQGTNGWHD